ncbi:MAG: bacillithiol biosynthesis deacetylase BshB1 [Flavobacteriales bacterium]|nr:bacillithiol biosynthesis deacetylase BshB1 [Flavobacteriales bacterium]|tara:strand:+ start:1088 stop:1795 length:708 start_codon:yes stop_codon:yes gene_type:complete
MDKQLDILAFGAHPDDVELGCGGTIAKQVNLGSKIGIVDLTRGELGTRGTAEIRDKEATLAAQILGVEFRHNMGFKDGFFQNNELHQMELVKIIRKYRPCIVLANAVNDRHPDHKKGSDLVSTACFLAGLPKVKTGQEAWRPDVVYHYIQFEEIEPNFVIDVSDFMSIKMDAVRAFSSQFFDASSKEPETIISSQGFLESVHYRAANLGRLSRVKFAEGFTTEKLLVSESLTYLK